jgi:hypothetical protein
MLGVLVISACSGGSGGPGGKGGTAAGAGNGGRGGAGGLAGTMASGGTVGNGGSATGTAGGGGSAGASGGGGGTAGATSTGGAGGSTGGGSAGASGAGGSAGASGTAGSGGTGGRGGATGAGGSAGSSGTAGSAGTGGACVTSVSGTVYDPAGTLPLYDVIVYAPTQPLAAFTAGVACGRCGALSGAPAAMTRSDVAGKFKLEGIPAGTNVPLVFQTGKWRRQVLVPTVSACTDTPLTDVNLTRLPRSKAEGDIPKIAITTGSADALECFIRRLGLTDGEFTTDTGTGRVNLYAGGGGTDSFMAGGAFPAATTLWSSPSKLAAYDMIGMSCEGSVSKYAADKPAQSVDNVAAYANGGGRLFLTHYHFTWLMQSTELSGSASYVGNLTPPTSSASEPIDLTINQAFPKGMALAQWLAGPAVMASTTLGRITADGLEHSVTGVNSPTNEWIYLPMNPQDSQHRRSSQFLSFNTPVGMPEAQQCGKALFTDVHIKQSASTVAGSGGGDDSDPSKPFPSGCKTNAMTPQMKALEFLFFDLGACL